MALLPFALSRVRDSPYQMGLTPFEIMFGTPPPIITNLQADLLAELDDKKLLDAIRGVQWDHKEIRTKLRAFYESGALPEHHRCWLGDLVYVKRDHQVSLEPKWKV